MTGNDRLFWFPDLGIEGLPMDENASKLCRTMVWENWVSMLSNHGTNPQHRMALLLEVSGKCLPINTTSGRTECKDAKRLLRASFEGAESPLELLQNRVQSLRRVHGGDWIDRLEAASIAEYSWAVGKLCDRLNNDAADISDLLGVPFRGAKDVKSIKLNKGDTHGPYGSTTLIYPSQGPKFYYKPRGSKREQLLNEVCLHLSKKFETSKVSFPNTKFKDDYLWQIAVKKVSSVAQNYLSDAVGQLIALCQSVGCSDLHRDNLSLGGVSENGFLLIDADVIHMVPIKKLGRRLLPLPKELLAEPLLSFGLFGDPTVPEALKGPEKPGLFGNMENCNPSSVAFSYRIWLHRIRNDDFLQEAVIKLREGIEGGRVLMRNTVTYEKVFNSVPNNHGYSVFERLLHLDTTILSNTRTGTAEYSTLTAMETVALSRGWIPSFYVGEHTGPNRQLSGGPFVIARKLFKNPQELAITPEGIGHAICMLKGANDQEREGHRLRFLVKLAEALQGPIQTTKDSVGVELSMQNPNISHKTYFEWLLTMDYRKYEPLNVIEQLSDRLLHNKHLYTS